MASIISQARSDFSRSWTVTALSADTLPDMQLVIISWSCCMPCQSHLSPGRLGSCNTLEHWYDLGMMRPPRILFMIGKCSSCDLNGIRTSTFKQQLCHAGTAVAMVPSKEMQEATEKTAASHVLKAEPRAAAAYDHVPFKSATCVYTLDTSTNIFLMHSIQVSLPLSCKEYPVWQCAN